MQTKEKAPQPGFTLKESGREFWQHRSKRSSIKMREEAIYTANGTRVSEHYRYISFNHVEELDGEVVVAKRADGIEIILKYNGRKFIEMAFPSGVDGLAFYQQALKKKEGERAVKVPETQIKLKKGASDVEKIEHSNEIRWAKMHVKSIDAEIVALQKIIWRKQLLRRILGRTWRNKVVNVYVGVPEKGELGYIEGSTKMMVMAQTPYVHPEKIDTFKIGVLCTVEEAISHVELAHNRRKSRR